MSGFLGEKAQGLPMARSMESDWIAFVTGSNTLICIHVLADDPDESSLGSSGRIG